MIRKLEKPNSNSLEISIQLIEWLRHYAENHFNIFLADERRCLPPSIVLELGNHGFMGLCVPTKYGGLQLKHKDYYQVIMQLGAIDLSLATLVTLHNENGICPILYHAKSQIKNELIPQLARGRNLSAMGFTEPAFGTNIRAIKTEAVFTNNSWIINGIKRWNSSGWANIINIYANSKKGETKETGITGFVVTRDMDGVKIGPESLTMGFKSIIQNSLFLKDLELSDDYVLGTPHKGLVIIDETLFYARIAACYALLGNIKRSLQLGCRFLEKRNSPIGKLHDYPQIRAKLNHVLSLAYAIENLANQITTFIDQNNHIPQAIPMLLKAFTSNVAIQAAELNMKLVGGRGYMETNHLARMFRDVYASYYGEGTNDSLLYLIGQSELHNNAVINFIMTHYGQDSHLNRFNKIMLALSKSIESSHDKKIIHWLYTQISKPLIYLLLMAAIEKDTKHNQTNSFHAEIAALLQQSLDELEGTSLNNTFFPTFKDIKQEIASYTAAIGDIEFQMAGEETKLDSYLQPSSFKNEKQENEISDLQTNVKLTTKDVHQMKREELQMLIKERIAISLNLPIEQIEPHTSLLAYGLDSMTFFNISFELEEKFGINFSEDPFPMDVTLEQLVDIINERIHENK